jgi:uncharacterized membrane protein
MTVGVVVSLCLLLGAACGLRSLTPPAVVCWAAHLGWIHLGGSHLAFLANPIAAGIFTLLALGELFGDKTSKIGPRTAPGPLIFRIITGALCGAALAIAGHVSHAGHIGGAIAGAIGAIAGTFAGFRIRRALTAPGKLPDLPVALVEDLITIGGSLFLVTRF